MPPQLERIEIEGPVAMNENSSADFNCRAFYDNGSSQIVDADLWTVDCIDDAGIDENGVLTTFDVDVDTPCQISASYTEDGITVEDDYHITIKDFVPLPELIIDNGDPGTTPLGNWEITRAKNAWGEDSVYTYWSGRSYTFEGALTGSYFVDLWWSTSYANRCTAAPVEIYDGDTLLTTVYVDMGPAQSGQWVRLRTDAFTFNGTAKVVINSEGGCSTCADAVRFVQ